MRRAAGVGRGATRKDGGTTRATGAAGQREDDKTRCFRSCTHERTLAVAVAPCNLRTLHADERELETPVTFPAGVHTEFLAVAMAAAQALSVAPVGELDGQLVTELDRAGRTAEAVESLRLLQPALFALVRARDEVADQQANALSSFALIAERSNHHASSSPARSVVSPPSMEPDTRWSLFSAMCYRARGTRLLRSWGARTV